MHKKASERELFMVALEIAKTMYGYSKTDRKKILSKAKQILDEEPQSEVEM